MKRINLVLSILIVGILSGCGLSHRLVDSDFSYKGRFTEYKSFAFLDSNVEGFDPYYSQQMKNMITQRLSVLGYDYNPEAPDLLITYIVRDEPITVPCFYQGSLSSWIIRSNYNEGKRGNYDNYKKEKVTLPAGSLAIYFLDAKEYEIVWLGYTKMSEIQFQDRQLVASTRLILDKYFNEPIN